MFAGLRRQSSNRSGTRAGSSFLDWRSGDQLTSTIHVKGDGTAGEEEPEADEYQKGYRPCGEM